MNNDGFYPGMIFIFGLIIGGVTFGVITSSKYRKEIVDANAGHYAINSKTGDKDFIIGCINKENN